MSERNTARIVLAGLLWLAALPAVAADELPVRDPTIAPGVTAARDSASGQPLRLRSTQVSKTSRSAVINDRVVSTGSTIGGAKVLSIEPGRVQLRRGSELITLRVTPPQVKRPADGEAS